MRSLFPELVNCPHCQSRNPAAEDRCQACGRTLTLYIGPPERVPRRFGLGSLMLLIALVAVCLVVAREAQALGVLLLVHVVPAFFRTVHWATQRAADGRPMGLIEKAGAFISSLTMVWLLLLMSGIAFGAVLVLGGLVMVPLLSLFVPTHEEFWALIPACALAVVAALATIYYLGRALWSVQGFYQDSG